MTNGGSDKAKTFTTAELSKITGIKLSRLNTWLNLNLIRPSIQTATGYGSKNVFSELDLYRVILMKKMIEGGYSREIASDIVNNVPFYDDEQYGLPKLLSRPSTPEDKIRHDLWLIIFKNWDRGEKAIQSCLYNPNRKTVYSHSISPNKHKSLDDIVSYLFGIGYEIAFVFKIEALRI